MRIQGEQDGAELAGTAESRSAGQVYAGVALTRRR